MPPPRTIANAVVLEWARSDRPFGLVRDTHGRVAAVIHGLALCRYAGDTQVYRFSCDARWQTQQDGVYDDVEEAKARLPDQYKNAPIDWQRMPE